MAAYATGHAKGEAVRKLMELLRNELEVQKKSPRVVAEDAGVPKKAVNRILNMEADKVPKCFVIRTFDALHVEPEEMALVRTSAQILRLRGRGFHGVPVRRHQPHGQRARFCRR